MRRSSICCLRRFKQRTIGLSMAAAQAAVSGEPGASCTQYRRFSQL